MVTTRTTMQDRMGSVRRGGGGGRAHTTTTTKTSPTAAAPYRARYLATLTLLLVVVVLAAASRSPTLTGTANATDTADTADGKIDVNTDSINVHGPGFSGFWYTLGRISSSSNSAASDNRRRRRSVYHCYSAGCLAVMVSLSGRGVRDVLNAMDGARRGRGEGSVGTTSSLPSSMICFR